MRRIIVADDEALIRRLVYDFLKKSDFETIQAEDGEQALALFKEHPDVSLMIVDIMMPGIDGWEVCRRVRETSSVPIILLTARGEEFDQLTGFEAGADEYVTKPFSPAVLVKRVEALIKLSEGKQRDGLQETGVRIDRDAYVAYLDGKPLDLTLKEYEILCYLSDHEGRVFTRDQLLDAIWGFDFYGNARTVDSHVARLRQKLGAYGDAHLKTVYGTGYKMEPVQKV